MRGADRVAQIVREAGIDHIFGLPGGSTINLFDAFYDHQDGVRVILARHEMTAAVMADMYGRLTGKPGVVIGQGPYVGSLGLFGIMGAFYASSPMLVMTDMSERGYFSQLGPAQGGSGDYGSVNLRTIFGSAAKYVALAVTPAEAAICVQQAIKHALVGRPGPAAVLFRRSALVENLGEESFPPVHATKRILSIPPAPADAAEVEKAAKKLRQAKRPLIIAGNGVHAAGAYEELRRVAEETNAPVATSFLGKSAIPETHRLSLGMMGTFGTDQANVAISRADVILVVGTRLSPTNTAYMSPKLLQPKEQTIIHLDIDARNAGWSFPADIGLIGDARAVLGQLLKALQAIPSQRRSEDWPPAPAWPDAQKESGPGWEGEPVHPRRLVHEVSRVLPADALVTLDAGNNRLWMAHDFRPQAVRTFFGPGGLAGMGWGPPAALAAKMLLPDQPVLSMVSDGGLAIVMDVFLTARQYQVPFVTVVFNDSALGMVNDEQREKGRTIASEFVSTNFAEIARAMGVWGRRVARPQDIAPAVSEALACGQPALVDVVINRQVSHLTIASKFHEKKAGV